MSSLSDSTADRLQDNKLNSKDNIYIDEDEVEGSGRGGEVSLYYQRLYLFAEDFYEFCNTIYLTLSSI